jgi:hypothetical protein
MFPVSEILPVLTILGLFGLFETNAQPTSADLSRVKILPISGLQASGNTPAGLESGSPSIWVL